MQSSFRTIKHCRSCKSSRLTKIISLGKQHLVGFSTKEVDPIRVPLTLMLCEKCNLVQLKQTTNPDLLWNAEYGYRSGINDTMRQELKQIAQTCEKIVGLSPNDIVMDIGCNDGTLLSSFKGKDIIRVGYDPSHNVISFATSLIDQWGEKNVALFVDYFSQDPFNIRFPKRKAKIITAIAMFYDLDNPNKFLQDVKACLSKEGMLVVQQNYLLGMLKNNAFDNILHEHLEYYSLTSLNYLLNKNGLEVFDVLTNSINGGSFRTYIRHKGSKISVPGGMKRVREMLENEKQEGLLEKKTYLDFAKRIKNNGNELLEFLKREHRKGKVIYIYAASTRGNSLLQFYGIDQKLITAASERNPYKWGKTTVGTNIPIVSEEDARLANPDYYLVLPWYFKKEFLRREKQYLENGGKMIFPLPQFTIVEK